MAGTPDWQKPTQVADNPVVNLSAYVIAPSGSYDTGWQASASWQAVQIRMTSATGYGTVSIQFADSELASPYFLWERSWYWYGSVGLHVMVPVYARYFKIVVDNTSSAGTGGTIDLYVATSRQPVNRITYLSEVPAMIDGSSITVPASSTHQLFPAWLWEGQTWMNAHFYDTAGKLNIAINRYYHANSEYGGAGYWPGYTADIHQMITVPDDYWGVNITNTDSSASHELSVYLIRA